MEMAALHSRFHAVDRNTDIEEVHTVAIAANEVRTSMLQALVDADEAIALLREENDRLESTVELWQDIDRARYGVRAED